MTIDTNILIGMAGLALSIGAFFVGRISAAKAKGERDGTILTEIGYIKSNTDEIKRRMDEQDKRYVDVITRLTKVESSTAQAHKRLDEHIKIGRDNNG
jgi:hypothetical protein